MAIKSYAFRFIDASNKLTGYYGTVSGVNADQLFQTIDEYGDPFSVQLKPIIINSFCFKYIEHEGEDQETEIAEIEICESIYEDLFFDKSGWKNVVWTRSRENVLYFSKLTLKDIDE